MNQHNLSGWRSVRLGEGLTWRLEIMLTGGERLRLQTATMSSLPLYIHRFDLPKWRKQADLYREHLKHSTITVLGDILTILHLSCDELLAISVTLMCQSVKQISLGVFSHTELSCLCLISLQYKYGSVTLHQLSSMTRSLTALILIKEKYSMSELDFAL